MIKSTLHLLAVSYYLLPGWNCIGARISQERTIIFFSGIFEDNESID